MESSVGRIEARLAESAETAVDDELVGLINRNVNPPDEVALDDVHVRVMYAVSDAVNSFGGRFPPEEHQRLAELLVDSPVIVGHRKDKLPVGRTFHAEVVQKDGGSWVKSYFYWLRSAAGAENLKNNIDGGVYKECSIGFTFLLPRCSICGHDIRTCRHQPLERYRKDKGEAVCHFDYCRIERVLETSLVYRGATPATSITKELAGDDETAAADEPGRSVAERVITGISELDPGGVYLVVPFYEAVPVMLTVDGRKALLTRTDGSPLPARVGQSLRLSSLPPMRDAYGHLIGFRGKERCPVDHLERYLKKGTGSVTRVELRLFPSEENGLEPTDFADDQPVRMIRHASCGIEQLPAAVRRLMTRSGVRIWSVDKPPPESPGLMYRPGGSDSGYWLIVAQAREPATLVCAEGGELSVFQIRQFDLSRFLRGARFIADTANAEPLTDRTGKTVLNGNLIQLRRQGEAVQLTLEGGLSGIFVLRPVVFEKRERFLFYRLSR